MRTPFLQNHAALVCLAAGALCIVIIRACVQSITIDEASYLIWASRQYWFVQWMPSSGNHVLNSLLMRLSTAVFGISELTVRMPAIIGAILYIGSALNLALLLTGRKLLQLALFTCLVYNPMVLDYLVAARGYSLAIGFLTAAIAVIASVMLSGDGPINEGAFRNRCVLPSVFLALSFAANFSFAMADGFVMLFFLGWAVLRLRPHGLGQYVRLASACFLPGAIVAFLICGYTLWNWPAGQFSYGSRHLSEMWKDLRDATFDDVNPDIVNPMLLEWLHWVKPVLPYIAVLTLLSLVAAMEIGRWRSHLPNKDRLVSFVRLLAGIAAATLLAHWIAFRTIHLLLPRNRTALFFVPFWTLAFGGALAARFRSERRDPVRSIGMGVFVAIAIYFIACVRLGYFKEWKFDMDSKQLYWLAEDLHRRCGISDFGVDWRYHLAFNFYREAYNNFALKEFQGSRSDELPPNKAAYVLYLPVSGEFVKQQRLQVIYHSDESGSGLAIRGCAARSE